MNQLRSPHGVRFSLRGLLATIAFFAVACAALKFANGPWWLTVSSAAVLLLMAMAVVALVGHGPRRAFARGFVACVAVYAVLMYVEGDKKYGAAAHQQPLPTTRLLTWTYDVAKRETYRDYDTDEPLVGFDPGRAGGRVQVTDNTGYVAVYDPSQPDRPILSGSGGFGNTAAEGYLTFGSGFNAGGYGGGYGNGGYGAGGYGGSVAKAVKRSVVPQSRTFMAIGHVLWGLVLGLVGGQFALFVCARRESSENYTERGDET